MMGGANVCENLASPFEFTVYTRFVDARRCDLSWPVMAGWKPDRMFPNLFPPQFSLQFRGFSVIRGASHRFWI